MSQSTVDPSNIKIRGVEIELVSLNQIKLNPVNRNKHSKEQIDQLCKIIKYQGFRTPGTISNRSGLLIAGEGRYLAAKKLKMTHMPIMRQDFDDEEQEYAHGIADNALQMQAELDMSAINADLANLGPDFDLDNLGFKDFVLDVSEKESAEALNPDSITTEFIVAVYCGNEHEQEKFFSEMNSRGLMCKLIS